MFHNSAFSTTGNSVIHTNHNHTPRHDYEFEPTVKSARRCYNQTAAGGTIPNSESTNRTCNDHNHRHYHYHCHQQQHQQQQPYDIQNTINSNNNQNHIGIQHQSQSLPYTSHIKENTNILIELLENELWFEAYLQCLVHPLDCLPVTYQSKSKSSGRSTSTKDGMVYCNTPLGIACRKFNNRNVFVPPNFPHRLHCDHDEDDVMVDANADLLANNDSRKSRQSQAYITQFDIIKAIFRAYPHQIRCNQIRVGQTPLLDILSNPHSTMEVTKFMIDADAGQCQYNGNENINRNNNFNSQNVNSNIKTMAIGRRDSNGLLPLHHLIGQVHRNITIEPEQSKALHLIKYIVRLYPALLLEAPSHHVEADNGDDDAVDIDIDSNSNNNVSNNNNKYISPLVHLLSQKAGNQQMSDIQCMKRITTCAALLLDAAPALIHTKSVMTSCTPLHMALRNGYGDNIELIKILLRYDCDRGGGLMVMQRNKFGDLPFHLLATVGVGIETWKILFDHVSKISYHNRSNNPRDRIDRDPIEGPSPFIWTANNHGYTILHLAWMRQINGKCTYPMSYTRNLHVLMREKMYYTTLKEAVDRVLLYVESDVNAVNNSNCNNQDQCHQKGDDVATTLTADAAHNNRMNRFDVMTRNALGSFWEILKLFLRNIRASHDPSNNDTISRDTDANDFQNFLHATYSLIGPLLPQPILTLIIAAFNHQAKEIDCFGRLPLHYLCSSFSVAPVKESSYYLPIDSVGWYVTIDCSSPSSMSMSALRGKGQMEFDCIVEQLLALNKEAASVPDKNGFFPLHLVMDGEKKWSNFFKEAQDIEAYNKLKDRRSFGHCVVDWALLVRLVAEANPDVLGMPFPNMDLYPFMSLATHVLGNIDLLYTLITMLPWPLC